MFSQENLQRLIQLYKSGRYQCDLWFYQNLMILIKQLDMYDFIPTLENNLKNVHKIYQLTQQNSNSLNEQFDQDQATQRAEQIKKCIHKLNPNDIIKIMQHSEKLKFTSYTHHAAKLISKYNYHPKYQSIGQNIINSVYDPQLKVDEIMICTLFMLRNTQKVEEILMIYNKSIQNALVMMKEFRKNYTSLRKLVDLFKKEYKREDYSQKQQGDNEQMKQQTSKANKIRENLKTYCFGVYFMYATVIKICNLVKILDGKKNYLLKLNSYRSDVEDILDIWGKVDQEKSQEDASKDQGDVRKVKDTQKEMEYMPIQQLKNLFIGDKSGIQTINTTCKICLRVIKSQQNKGQSQPKEKRSDNQSISEYHRICQKSIKQLMHPQVQASQ